jgi:RimJ/RimL family protein N-acetyltransferase
MKLISACERQLSGSMFVVEIAVRERLIGKGVALRPIRVSDAAAYARAFVDDPELGRLIGLEQDRSETEVIERVRDAPERARAGRGVELAICALDADAFLGSLSLHSFACKHQRCELGFWIAPQARGRGLARAAIASALSWAFDDLAIARMEMTTIHDNAATRVIARRSGFREEGTACPRVGGS